MPRLKPLQELLDRSLSLAFGLADFFDRVLTPSRTLLNAESIRVFIWTTADHLFQEFGSDLPAESGSGDVPQISAMLPMAEKLLSCADEQVSSVISREPDQEIHLQAFRLDLSPVTHGVLCLSFSTAAGTRHPTWRAGLQLFTEWFRNRLNCSRIRQLYVQDQLENMMKKAGYPARIKRESGKYISRIQNSFNQSSGIRVRRPPYMYLHLVDRARGVIRTVHGVGQPVIVLSSLIQPLDSPDILPDVVRNGTIELICGNDRRRFDQKIYKKYQLERFVRVWIPLFQVPPGLLDSAGSYDAFVDQSIRITQTESREAGLINLTGTWERNKPPLSAVFGVLELGFIRHEKAESPIFPWTEDLIRWATARALEMCSDLYEVTLLGVFQQIGSLAAQAGAGASTCFQIMMLDRKTCFHWTFPGKDPWNAPDLNLSEPDPETSPDSRESAGGMAPANVRICYDDKPDEDENDLPVIQQIRDKIFETADWASGIALRLHDDQWQLSQLASELEEREPFRRIQGDRTALEICREVWRESRAESVAFYLCVRTNSDISDQPSITMHLIAPSFWPEPVDESRFTDLHRVIRTVVLKRIPLYGNKLNRQYGVLPLELADGTIGVISLLYKPGDKLTTQDKRILESWIPRWIYKMSLRRLIITNRFFKQMNGLRQHVTEARKLAVELPTGAETDINGHWDSSRSVLAVDQLHGASFADSFIREFLKRISGELTTDIAMMTLHYKSKTGPGIVHRYICACPEKTVDRFVFVASELDGPCRDVCLNSEVLVYGPRDPRRCPPTVQREIEETIQQMDPNTESPEFRRLKRSLTLLSGAEGYANTLISCPVVIQGRDPRKSHAAITIVIPGEHTLESAQRDLVLELGRIIADTLGQLTGLDLTQARIKHRNHINELRLDFEQALTYDDIVGVLLKGLGYPPKGATSETKKYWGLAEHAVIWLLSEDGGELVVRSARGNGLPALRKLMHVSPDRHPLFENLKIDTRDHGMRIRKLQLWSFPLAATPNLICRAYGSKCNAQWLLSFPIVDAGQQLTGIIDLLRPQPLSPEEHTALEEMLQDLSHQFCSAMEQCLHRRTNKIAGELYAKSTGYLRSFKASEVYKTLVNQMQAEFRCECCDLYLHREGMMMLHATTRQDLLHTEHDKFAYFLKSDSQKNEILSACMVTGQPQIRHQRQDREPGSLDHLSSDLQNILENDIKFERMAVPLKLEGKASQLVGGILYIRGPMDLREEEHQVPQETGRTLKKSGLFSRVEFGAAVNMGIVLQRIVQMVELVEHQGLLANMLVHSLGQPLQLLRHADNELLRKLSEAGLFDHQAKLTRDRLTRAFELVHIAKDQLGLFTKLSQPDTTVKLDRVNIPALVRECCDFMAPIARENDNIISYAGVQRIDTAPVQRRWMRLALLNLIENACKYSFSPREIKVSAWERERRIIIKVANFGVGIPHLDQDRIFEPYFRSHVPDSKRKRVGTGIGLSIVREVIEGLHRGSINVESKPFFNVERGSNVEDIADVEHRTVFTIELDRTILEKMGDHYDERTES